MIRFFEWVDSHEASMLLYIVGFVSMWAAPLVAVPILMAYFVVRLLTY